MLGAFLIFFREALEASMICSIMLAYLKQLDRKDRFKDVWIGVASAIVVAVVGGVIVFHTLKTYDGTALQGKIEGVTYFVACAVLTYMTFWMKRQSRQLSRELKSRIAAALTGGSMFAISFIAFITVGREGLETVVFMIAIAFHTAPALLLIGAIVGILAGLFLSYFIYILGKRINLKQFFNTMGTLLMLFGAGLLADAIESFQQVNWIPFHHVIWHTSYILSENTTFGDILHSFFGYADSPSILQVALYAAYLAFVLWFFWRRSPGKPMQKQFS